MKIKQIPEDFIVDEIYNLENFKNKDEDKDYFYFKLTKTNYNQMRAIDIISTNLNASKRLIHFAGTKDKVGVTSQIISIRGINEENFKKQIEYINNNIQDINLEYIGKFPGRINLGDNLGNSFKITVRDLEENDINKAKANLEILKDKGVLNYFDSQRFGFANNSHIIGKYILQNKPELAVKEILTSCPKNPTEDLKNFTEEINKNWEEIKTQNQDKIEELIEVCPDKFKEYKLILNHLKKAKNDFPGAFRTIMKKIRTLYLNAYQSHIFNKTIKTLRENNQLENNKTIELINHLTKFNELPKEIQDITNNILKEDEVTLEMFNLKSWPELKPKYQAHRETLIKPKNLNLEEKQIDELNENKLKILATFDLESGQYATNIVSQLFN